MNELSLFTQMPKVTWQKKSFLYIFIQDIEVKSQTPLHPRGKYWPLSFEKQEAKKSDLQYTLY